MPTGSDDGIQEDVVAEARRLVERVERENLPLRLLGGVAIKLRSRDLPPALIRGYGDLDWVTRKGGSARAQEFFRSAGYEPETRFNALHGRDRLLFFDTGNGRQVDVFVGSFRMSHEVPLEDRINVEAATIPLAELLVTKLQIYEINQKDVGDALALLYEHDLGESDGETINAARIASLCAADWGLWRTFTGNLATCRDLLQNFDLPESGRRRVGGALDELMARMESEPKSRRWKLRARLGERKRWYELPEEVTGERQ